MTQSRKSESAPGQSAAERRILNLCRERDGLFERLDRIDSTSPERAKLLSEVTAINRRIYICEMEKERV